ncbi:hypothetical protein ACKI1Q_26455 [Streptomyces galilaeus]|nr:hypothetical protein [Streptomyces galilaeus]
MIMLIVVGILLILVSQMGESSAGFLASGIAATALGVLLLVVTMRSVRRQRRS